MTTDQATSSANELVPLADRLRYLRFLRIAIIGVVSLVAGFNLGHIAPAASPIWPATAVYIGCFGIGETVWRLFRRRGLWLFSFLVMLDAAYLVYITHATGGISSPLRYLIVLHLVSVALLASYRTGLKLVVWYALLLSLDYKLRNLHVGRVNPWPAQPGSEYARMIYFALIIAAITLGTAALSAVNERELRRRRFDLEALATLAANLEQCDDARDVARRTVDSIVENFDIERIAVVGATPRLQLLAGREVTDSDSAVTSPGVNSVISQACQLRATLLPAQLHPKHDPWLVELFPGAKNLVVIPLFAEGGGNGVLVFEHGTRRGSRVERRLLTILERFASHAALALRNATLLEAVQEAASTDALTGIPNRRSFEEALDREVARSDRTGEPVSLVMLDLDHFKPLNDTYGHQVGDEVLRKVAQNLAANCREMDIAARYGGEEFTVILPNCGADEVAASATRLWAGVCNNSHDAPLTASAGYATYPDNASTRSGLIGAADEALYRAKAAGRDQVMGSTHVQPRTALGLVGQQATLP
jgi:diguanylate cyclase (GGDEF)-like protein